MKRVRTQTINVDKALWDDVKHYAQKNHAVSASQVVSQLLKAWNDSKNKHITIKGTHLKKDTKVRRSLYCDINIWKEAMRHAKSHFGKSASYIIDILLRNWLEAEKKRKVENPKQAKLI